MTSHPSEPHFSTSTATACGKAILLGEHAVVYGYPAIAVALPTVRLQVSLPPLISLKHAPSAQVCGFSPWEEAWRICVKQKDILLTQEQRKLLTQALALCLKHVSYDLNHLSPGPLVVQSDMDVGRGLGGSAALSTALSRAVFHWVGVPYTSVSLWAIANSLDALFHGGQASGIDTATVVFNGIIGFTKGQIPRQLKPKTPFWLACVDSGVEKKTANMIERVKHQVKHTLEGEQTLVRLGLRSQKVLAHFDHIDPEELGMWMSQSQDDLRALGVSCPEIEYVIQNLPALGAKLTGSGGGGFVIGVFAERPENLEALFPGRSVFVVHVG